MNHAIGTRHPYLNPFDLNHNRLAAERVLSLKNNISGDHGGLAYRLLSPEPGDMPVVAWESAPVDVSVEDAV